MNFFEGIIGGQKQAEGGPGGMGRTSQADAGSRQASSVPGQNSGWLSKVGAGFLGASGVEEDNFISSMKHLETLQDKNIIVTGGTGGIGVEVVTELVKYAGRIVLLL